MNNKKKRQLDMRGTTIKSYLRFSTKKEERKETN